MRPTPHSHGARKKAARSSRNLRTQRRRFRAHEKEIKYLFRNNSLNRTTIADNIHSIDLKKS